MPYDPQIHSSIIISKEHKEKLKVVALKQRRTLQATLELLIDKAYTPPPEKEN